MSDESGDGTPPPAVIRPYARRRMAQRGISEEAVQWVVRHYHTRRPAPRRGTPAEIFIGDYDGRDLKVYVRKGSNPPYVKTVVWQGEQ
jgi:hypothetical protein